MPRPAVSPGRLLERIGDDAPRGMTVHDRTRLIGRLRHFSGPRSDAIPSPSEGMTGTISVALQQERLPLGEDGFYRSPAEPKSQNLRLNSGLWIKLEQDSQV